MFSVKQIDGKPHLCLEIALDQATLDASAHLSSKGGSYILGGTGGLVPVPGALWRGKPVRFSVLMLGSLSEEEKAKAKAGVAVPNVTPAPKPELRGPDGRPKA